MIGELRPCDDCAELKVTVDGVCAECADNADTLEQPTTKPTFATRLELILDDLAAEVSRTGHTTPFVEVSAICYRWMAKRIGPVRPARRGSNGAGKSIDDVAAKHIGPRDSYSEGK